ncbi:MAG: gamma-glutamyl-gamma-aminobutyrate hydrolase family protein, partial [Bdellovibrionales bacterium]|nr:gamma-glutamyl-gamma-aminobutyrate hydrolase family protein [Bdellovibrionales bacterium]
MNSNLKIGVSAKFHNKSPAFYGEAQRHIQYIETSIANWVAHNKALPLLIPSETVKSEFSDEHFDVVGYAKELDGLILQGGVDIHPSIYDVNFKGEFPYPSDIVRDKYELKLIEAFIDQKKPILGICRGMQLINVYFGGTLFHDLETNGFSRHLDKESEIKFSHGIEIEPGGILASIYPHNAHVISVHHQGIEKLGEGLNVEALSEDALVEAVSIVDENKFLLAVQWHPEFHVSNDEGFLDADKLLNQFITVVKNRKFYGDLNLNRKKSVKFNKSTPLTLGTEIELQVLDKETFDL